MFDSTSEYRLLASFIDNPDTIFKVSDTLFTEGRVALYRAMRDAYLKYGELTHEGVEYFYKAPVPGELDAARGSKPEPLIDRLRVLQRKRQLADVSNRINVILAKPDPSLEEIQEALKFDTLGEDLDSSIQSGVSEFISDFNQKRSGKYKFVRTGLRLLDYMLGGEWGRKALTVIVAQPGGGKCFDGNVLCADGVYRHISKIKNNDIVMSFDEDTHKIVPKKVLAQICTGVQNSYKVSFHGGKSVLVSDVHPFLTGRGWIPTSDLTTSDLVATSKRTEINSEQDYDRAYLRLLAYLIGDGNLSQRLSFSGSQENIIQDMHYCVQYIGDDINKQPGNNVDWNISGGNTRKLLKSVGLLHKKSDEKFIPEFIFSLRRDAISEFLGALYSTDGWLSLNKNNKAEVGYGTTSYQLAKDVQHLLTYFDISSTISSRTGWYYLSDRTKKYCKTAYTISFSNIHYVRRFLENIDVIGRPGAKELIIEATSASTGNGDTDRIPYQLVPNIKSIHKSRGDLGVRRSRVIDYPEYKYIADGDVYWSQVKSVEKIEDRVMWDLEVEDSHNFIGDGVVIHNTALICNSMLNMALQGQAVLFLSLEMPKEQVISRLVSGLTEINNRDIRAGSLIDGKPFEESQLESIEKAVEQLQKLPIYIIDKGSMTVAEMISQIRYHTQIYKIDAFFVDYLQIVNRDESDDARSLGEVTQAFRDAAVRYDIAGIVLSQQNRGYEGLNSVFGSGRIAHIADSIFEIKSREDDIGSDDMRIMDINFLKNRHGPLGSQAIQYIPRYLKFIG